MKLKIMLIGVTILFFLVTADAQVTIGSDIMPRKGTLLDLKENGNTGKDANANKGLGLPRVALSSLTTLTVDEDINSGDYVGLTVYNTATNTELSPGTYCWFGNTWKQVVLVNEAGTDGNMLRSNGDNTYSWSTITIPEYKFWKPTQKSFFDPNKANDGARTYDYPDVVLNNGNPNLYKNDFVYTDKIYVNSDATSRKFLLVETTANVTKRTLDNEGAQWSFREEMQVEILINNRIVKTYKRAYPNPKGAVTNSIIDLFSIVPLDEFQFSKGEYPIQVRISNISNSYSRNRQSASTTYPGNFKESGPFLDISVINFGFILYEEE